MLNNSQQSSALFDEHFYDEHYYDEHTWVIWNGTLGLLDTATLGEIKLTPIGREAWLEEPYDMVGAPFTKVPNKVTASYWSFPPKVHWRPQRLKRPFENLRRNFIPMWVADTSSSWPSQKPGTSSYYNTANPGLGAKC